MLSKLKNMLKHISVTPFPLHQGVKRLRNILRVVEVGSSCKTFEPISAIKKRSINKVWRTTEDKGHVVTIHLIHSHNSTKVMLNHSVMMTVKMRKKIFLKMGTKKDISFLLIPITIVSGS